MSSSRPDHDMRSMTISPSESPPTADQTPTSVVSSSTVVSQPSVPQGSWTYSQSNRNSKESRGPSRVERSEDGAMYLVWEPGVTETTTTHVTRTVTTFAPLRLPAPPPTSVTSPEIRLPTHLSPALYPLSLEPTPHSLRSFSMDLEGKKVVFNEKGGREEESLGEKREREGTGWVKVGSPTRKGDVGWEGLKRVGFHDVLRTVEGKTRAQGKQREVVNNGGNGMRSPTFSNRFAASSLGIGAYVGTGGGDGRSRSPPRKRLRDASASGGIPSPSPVMDRSPSPTAMTTTTNNPTADQPPFDPHQPSIGSGIELATFYSLPTLLNQFDSLPPKIKEHFLIHCLRRTTLPSLQQISNFISPALKFDFVALFPGEISIVIFTFFDRASLAAAARVSRKWNEMIDCQRGVWAGRLKAEGMWYGFGAEEEEEELVRRRWEVRDMLDERSRVKEQDRSLSTPGEASTDPFSDHKATYAGAVAFSNTTSAPSEGPEWEESMRDTKVKVEEMDGSDELMKGSPAARSDGGRMDYLKRRSHPLKQVYRLRQQQKANWAKPNPRGGRFMFHGHGAHVVTCLQFDNDKIVSASDDHSINVYAIKDGSLRCRLDGHEGGVWALQYKADVLVSGSTDRTVRVWSIKRHEQTHIFHGHTSTVRCLQIVEPVKQPNGEFLPPYPLIVTGSRDNTLRVWRLPREGEPEYKSNNNPYLKKTEGVNPEENPFHNHLLAGHTNAVRAIAAHGRYCVSGSYDCTVRVWDIVKGTCLHVLKGHAQKVYSVVLDTRRNRVASGSMDGTVKVWDLLTGKCLSTLEGHSSLVGLLGISPNHLVSAAADSTIKLWDATSLQCLHTLKAHQGAITCFQHDETKIISGSEGTLKMWDIRDGSFVRDLVTGVQGVWRVSFSNRYLVSASNRVGLTVFDVIDFGDSGYDDGAGDESLDSYIVPEWERSNRLEPRTYQTTEAGDHSAFSQNPFLLNLKDSSKRLVPSTPTKSTFAKSRASNGSITADKATTVTYPVEEPSQTPLNQLPGTSPKIHYPPSVNFPNVYPPTSTAGWPNAGPSRSRSPLRQNRQTRGASWSTAQASTVDDDRWKHLEEDELNEEEGTPMDEDENV